MEFYRLKIFGLERDLPLVALGPKLKIASFNLLGDGELIERVAGELAKKLEGVTFDFLVGPEVKVVPLIQMLAMQLKKPRYIILRKNIMGYMTNPLTGKSRPTLVLNGPDAEILAGKRVVVIDDVVTTGQTLGVVAELLRAAGAEVASVLAIFKQGEEPGTITEPFSYLGKLPFFSSE